MKDVLHGEYSKTSREFEPNQVRVGSFDEAISTPKALPLSVLDVSESQDKVLCPDSHGDSLKESFVDTIFKDGRGVAVNNFSHQVKTMYSKKFKEKSIYEIGGPLSVKKKMPKKRTVKPFAYGFACVTNSPVEQLDDSSGTYVYKEAVEEDNEFSGEVILCSDPISNLDVIHCNNRFLDNIESNMGKKLWKTILGAWYCPHVLSQGLHEENSILGEWCGYLPKF